MLANNREIIETSKKLVSATTGGRLYKPAPNTPTRRDPTPNGRHSHSRPRSPHHENSTNFLPPQRQRSPSLRDHEKRDPSITYYPHFSPPETTNTTKAFSPHNKKRQPNQQHLRHHNQHHPLPQERNFLNKQVTIIPTQTDTDPPKKVYLFTPLPPHPRKHKNPPSRITLLMNRFFSSDDPKLVRWESMDNPSANLRLTNTLIQQKIETGLNKRLKALKLPQF